MYVVTDEEIGFRRDRLKILREERGSQATLAEAIGMRQKDVSGWEVGDHIPSDKNIVQLARHFGVTTDFLLGLVQERNQKSDIRQNPELLERLWLAVQKNQSLEAFELLTRMLKGEE